ncbi:MAG: sugar ABC transporter ATP-binding protein [Fastidiosipilaceae bacterium]
MKCILEMKHIYKSFPGVKVLQDVDLRLNTGEVHALMGENGAGKSTLMKILMGIYSADQGEILLNGEPVSFKNPREALDHGVSMIHQEMNPILDMKVYENVFVGREIHNTLGLVDKKQMARRTQTIFDEIGIHIDPTMDMRELSVAQSQLVEIVKAISVGAKIVIMDEPTSAITEAEVETLFRQIRRLKSQGVAILYISHKMDEIFEICDRITVLRDGLMIGSDLAKNLDEERLIKMMVGREISDVYPKADAEIGDVKLQVRDLSWSDRVKNVSFQLRKGEILGFAGLVGAGRSEVVESLFGMKKHVRGEVLIDGRPHVIRGEKNSINSKMALITEDRKFTGLNLVGTVKENITVVGLDMLFKNGILSKKVESEVSDRFIDELNIRTPSRNQQVANLSGGNQQKVVIAKWLLTEPDIIIMDEPTRGIDVGAKRDIYLLIGELVRAGKAVIIISSEIVELMGLCDRILVLSGGRITGELKREEFDQELIMQYASGLGGNE